MVLSITQVFVYLQKRRVFQIEVHQNPYLFYHYSFACSYSLTGFVNFDILNVVSKQALIINERNIFMEQQIHYTGMQNIFRTHAYHMKCRALSIIGLCFVIGVSLLVCSAFFYFNTTLQFAPAFVNFAVVFVFVFIDYNVIMFARTRLIKKMEMCDVTWLFHDTELIVKHVFASRTNIGTFDFFSCKSLRKQHEQIFQFKRAAIQDIIFCYDEDCFIVMYDNSNDLPFGDLAGEDMSRCLYSYTPYTFDCPEQFQRDLKDAFLKQYSLYTKDMSSNDALELLDKHFKRIKL